MFFINFSVIHWLACCNSCFNNKIKLKVTNLRQTQLQKNKQHSQEAKCNKNSLKTKLNINNKQNKTADVHDDYYYDDDNMNLLTNNTTYFYKKKNYSFLFKNKTYKQQIK